MHFTRMIARLLLATLTLQSLLIPNLATAAVVDRFGVDKTWAAHAAWGNSWKPLPIVLGRNVAAGMALQVYVPIDNWAEIAVGPYDAQHGFDPRQLQVPEWAVNNNLNAARNLPDGVDYSSRRIMLDRPYTQVWAAYDPVNATARILVQKAELGIDNRIHIYAADWTPWHGRDWMKVRAYLTPAEKMNLAREGNSPFQLFQADPSAGFMATSENQATLDPLWHNISMQGVQVALGLAMQHHRANFGIIYIPDTRFEQRQECDDGFFTTKCTTTVEGFAKPKWFLGLPKNLDSQPLEAAICVVPTAAGAGCDAQEHVAFSGISVREWTGGNLPIDEELLYTWSQTDSSFSMMGIGILLAVVTMGMALAYGLPMIGASAGVNAAGAATAATTGAAAVGGMVGGVYIAGTALATNESPFEAQADLLGKVGNGQLMPDLGAMGEQAQGLAAAVAPKMRAGVIGGTLTGASKMAYGDCRANPGAECAAADPGLAMRPKSYRRQNIPRDVYEAKRMCEARGLFDRALDRCMARLENLMMQNQQ